MRGPSDRVLGMWRAYERGATMTAVASEFGISTSRVSELFKRYGFPTERRAQAEAARRAARTKEMWQAYEAGASLAEVGQQFGLSAVRVSQLFRAAGLKARPHGSPGRKRREGGEKRRERALEMYALYLEGASLREVGQAFGLTEPRVLQIFQDAELPRRSPGAGVRAAWPKRRRMSKSTGS